MNNITNNLRTININFIELEKQAEKLLSSSDYNDNLKGRSLMYAISSSRQLFEKHLSLEDKCFIAGYHLYKMNYIEPSSGEEVEKLRKEVEELEKKYSYINYFFNPQIDKNEKEILQEKITFLKNIESGEGITPLFSTNDKKEIEDETFLFQCKNSKCKFKDGDTAYRVLIKDTLEPHKVLINNEYLKLEQVNLYSHYRNESEYKIAKALKQI